MRQPLRALLFVSGCALAILGRAEAVSAAIVKVDFSGTPASGFSQNFSGHFEYDQSCPAASPGVFNFTRTNYTHKIQYSIVGSAPASTTLATADPFTITTYENNFTTFRLVGACPYGVPGGSKVTIVIPYSPPAMTTLPPCTSFPPSPAPPASTFTVTNNAGTVTYYSGYITTITCPAVDVITYPTAMVCYPVPQPCVVYYACPPRQSCCLTRMFRRRSCGW